jgi:FAD/FMN-containing dehydrogenase
MAFGMATPSGFFASAGVAGLALGGGTGYLTRRFGLTVDNLLSADVVLADGRFVTASESSSSDLFWALRGGGGNFGLVTSFTFRCHDIGEAGAIIGGPMLYDLADTAGVMHWYRELLPRCPRSSTAGSRCSPSRPPAIPRGAVGPQVLRHRLALHRAARPGRRGARVSQVVRLTARSRAAADAIHRAAERL